jgi:hypothetical protein
MVVPSLEKMWMQKSTGLTFLNHRHQEYDTNTQKTELLEA